MSEVIISRDPEVIQALLSRLDPDPHLNGFYEFVSHHSQGKHNERTLYNLLLLGGIFASEPKKLKDPVWLKFFPTRTVRGVIRIIVFAVRKKTIRISPEAETLFQKARELFPDIVLILTGNNTEFEAAFIEHELRQGGLSEKEIRDLRDQEDEGSNEEGD